MAKKIKVFLGGYVNFTNAQNLNCRALAKYLNKDKFECAAMLYPNGNLAVNTDLAGVKLMKRHRPLRISGWLVYLRGIMWCDVAYLPKGELWYFCKKFSVCLAKSHLQQWKVYVMMFMPKVCAMYMVRIMMLELAIVIQLKHTL